jgi:hypothetical protein
MRRKITLTSNSWRSRYMIGGFSYDRISNSLFSNYQKDANLTADVCTMLYRETMLSVRLVWEQK